MDVRDERIGVVKGTGCGRVLMIPGEGLAPGLLSGVTCIGALVSMKWAIKAYKPVPWSLCSHECEMLSCDFALQLSN